MAGLGLAFCALWGGTVVCQLTILEPTYGFVCIARMADDDAREMQDERGAMLAQRRQEEEAGLTWKRTLM